MELTQPVMAGTDSIFQLMLDTFGQAGTVAIAVITAAVGLGVVTILGMYGWRMMKKWLAASK